MKTWLWTKQKMMGLTVFLAMAFLVSACGSARVKPVNSAPQVDFNQIIQFAYKNNDSKWLLAACTDGRDLNSESRALCTSCMTRYCRDPFERLSWINANLIEYGWSNEDVSVMVLSVFLSTRRPIYDAIPMRLKDCMLRVSIGKSILKIMRNGEIAEPQVQSVAGREVNEIQNRVIQVLRSGRVPLDRDVQRLNKLYNKVYSNNIGKYRAYADTKPAESGKRTTAAWLVFAGELYQGSSDRRSIKAINSYLTLNEEA